MPVSQLTTVGILPAGIHLCSWQEVYERFVKSFGDERGPRKPLAEAALVVLTRLAAEAVENAWIGGSFVTNKPVPADIDVVFEVAPGHRKEYWRDGEMRRIAGNDADTRAKLLHRVGVHAFPTSAGFVAGGVWIPILDGFQWTKPDAQGNRQPKGIIGLDLRCLPSP